MTYAETIKALEEKIKFQEFDESEYAVIKFETLKDVLDIYNRQKATIEKCADTLCKKEDMTQLIAEKRNQYYDELQAAKAEIERLKEECFIKSQKKSKYI